MYGALASVPGWSNVCVALRVRPSVLSPPCRLFAGCVSVCLVCPQASDWKSARRWRLLATDSGTLSFADLSFKRTQQSQQHSSRSSTKQPVLLASSSSSSSSSSSGGGEDAAGSYEVTAVDPSRLVNGYVVLLTWPPDGRFSPLHEQQPAVIVSSSSSSSSSSNSDSSSSSSDGGVAVRALVLPLSLEGDGPSNSTGERLGAKLCCVCVLL